MYKYAEGRIYKFKEKWANQKTEHKIKQEKIIKD